jgi:general secretion pathway protein G
MPSKTATTRTTPADPFTQSPSSWVAVPPDDPKKGGIYDVRSAAKCYERW